MPLRIVRNGSQLVGLTRPGHNRITLPDGGSAIWTESRGILTCTTGPISEANLPRIGDRVSWTITVAIPPVDRGQSTTEVKWRLEAIRTAKERVVRRPRQERS